MLFPRLGAGKTPQEDAFNQDASRNFIDKDTPYSKEAEKLMYGLSGLSGHLNRGQKSSTKNVTFLSNMVSGRIRTTPIRIKHVDGDKVVFEEGQEVRCDRLVICTGYKSVFP